MERGKGSFFVTYNISPYRAALLMSSIIKRPLSKTAFGTDGIGGDGRMFLMMRRLIFQCTAQREIDREKDSGRA